MLPVILAWFIGGYWLIGVLVLVWFTPISNIVEIFLTPHMRPTIGECLGIPFLWTWILSAELAKQHVVSERK